MFTQKIMSLGQKVTLNENGLPTHMQKLTAGIYEGEIKGWKIVNFYNGKKLSFDISIATLESEKIYLPKVFDYRDRIVIGTPLFSFLNDLDIIGLQGEISWDSLKDMPIKAEIKITLEGTPYINVVAPRAEKVCGEEDEIYNGAVEYEKQVLKGFVDYEEE